MSVRAGLLRIVALEGGFAFRLELGIVRIVQPCS